MVSILLSIIIPLTIQLVLIPYSDDSQTPLIQKEMIFQTSLDSLRGLSFQDLETREKEYIDRIKGNRSDYTSMLELAMLYEAVSDEQDREKWLCEHLKQCTSFITEGNLEDFAVKRLRWEIERREREASKHLIFLDSLEIKITTQNECVYRAVFELWPFEDTLNCVGFLFSSQPSSLRVLHPKGAYITDGLPRWHEKWSFNVCFPFVVTPQDSTTFILIWKTREISVIDSIFQVFYFGKSWANDFYAEDFGSVFTIELLSSNTHIFNKEPSDKFKKVRNDTFLVKSPFYLEWDEVISGIFTQSPIRQFGIQFLYQPISARYYEVLFFIFLPLLGIIFSALYYFKVSSTMKVVTILTMILILIMYHVLIIQYRGPFHVPLLGRVFTKLSYANLVTYASYFFPTMVIIIILSLGISTWQLLFLKKVLIPLEQDSDYKKSFENISLVSYLFSIIIICNLFSDLTMKGASFSILTMFLVFCISAYSSLKINSWAIDQKMTHIIASIIVWMIVFVIFRYVLGILFSENIAKVVLSLVILGWVMLLVLIIIIEMGRIYRFWENRGPALFKKLLDQLAEYYSSGGALADLAFDIREFVKKRRDPIVIGLLVTDFCLFIWAAYSRNLSAIIASLSLLLNIFAFMYFFSRKRKDTEEEEIPKKIEECQNSHS